MDGSKESKAALKLRKYLKSSTTQRWNLVWINKNKPSERHLYVIRTEHGTSNQARVKQEWGIS